MKTEAVPPQTNDITEEIKLDAIEHVVRYVTKGFQFGYFSEEDIEQHARLEALKGLPAFDTARIPEGGDVSSALKNFLFIRIKRRLLNLLRDKYKRSDAPCKKCHANEPHKRTTKCQRYADWFARNQSRINLIWPVDIDVVPEACATEKDRPEDAVALSELFALVDMKLPARLLLVYRKHMSGEKVRKSELEELEAEVKKIIGEPEANQ